MLTVAGAGRTVRSGGGWRSTTPTPRRRTARGGPCHPGAV